MRRRPNILQRISYLILFALVFQFKWPLTLTIGYLILLALVFQFKWPLPIPLCILFAFHMLRRLSSFFFFWQFGQFAFARSLLTIGDIAFADIFAFVVGIIIDQIHRMLVFHKQVYIWFFELIEWILRQQRNLKILTQLIQDILNLILRLMTVLIFHQH